MSEIRYSGISLDDQLDEEFMDQGTELSENYNDAMVYERHESPTQNCCKMSKLTKCNCSFLSKCSKPTKIVTAIVILITFKGLCLGLGYFSIFVHKPAPVLDRSYRAFTIPNHEASLNYEAFKLASSHNVTYSFRHFGRKKRSVSDRDFSPFLGTESQTKALHRSTRENINDQRSIQWKLQVIFLAVGDDEKNIFTKDRLEYIHTIERRIMNHTRFHDFCFKDHYIKRKDPAVKTIGDCAPLNSLMQYFYPTIDDKGNIHYDGLGATLRRDIKSTIEFAMATSDHFYYYVDQNVNKTHQKSSLLRTEVLFGSPIKGYSSRIQQRKEQAKKYNEFVLTYIDMLSSSSTDKVKILYGGNEIFDYEVNHAFWNDVKLALFSLAAIVIFMLILTSFSLWLTFFGIASILLCFPLAVCLYHNVFGIATFGILNGVAAFVIIGIGVDDVFVFINIFRQATNMKTTEARIMHTLVTAGKATFITSFTTAAAFAANTASSIPAVHQFGLFMFLIVSCCWITVLAVMLPALYIWDVGIKGLEEKCFSIMNYWICSKLQFKKRDLPEDIVAFVGGKQSQSTVQQIGHNIPVEEVNEDDDDVPLLNLDDPMEYYIERYGTGDDDEVLLIPDHRNLSPHASPQTRHDKVQQSSLMQMLQAGLYHYVALPVIKIRWVFIGVSLLLLIVSIVLITRIHPSTKPPQLFKESTNLQMLMDLKKSMGIIDDISCSKCSAIYDVDETNHYKPTHNHPTRHTEYKTTMSPRQTKIKMTTQRTSHPTKFSAVAPEFEIKPTNQTVFVGNKVMFHCIAKGYPTPVITWQKDGQEIPGNSFISKDGTLVMILVSKIDQGLYTCRATNQAGHNIAIAYLMITGSSEHLLYPTTRPPIVTTTTQLISHSTTSLAPPKSLPENFDMCKNTDCTKTKARPMLETGATVYVVFGIDGLDRSDIEPGHVMEKTKGKVLFDPSFNHHFKLLHNPGIIEGIAKLCNVCKEITAKTDLVKNGSAQCFSSTMPWNVNLIPECHDLPRPVEVYGRQAHAHVIGGLDRNRTGLLWWAFAFESTTSKSQSYFEAYKDYLKWEELITKIRTDLKSTPYLQSIFQTSKFWPDVMMEVVAVNSAIYSLVLSMVICLVAVAIFSGHVMLLFIVFVTILEMICLVTGLFYLAGWEMGGVEAISLSILVGSSVDYCVHLVEGFLLAGKAVPDQLKYNNAASRQWRTKAAVSHIGVSIFSSAMTTIVAAIPLTQATIQPFAKFGQILAINSTVSIIYCLTVCSALLAFMGPSKFISSWKSTLKMTIGTCVVVGSSSLLLFVISKCGVFIPGPNGAALFPN